ncbi:MAG: GerMN domain-containing protein [Candidatus Humimicrobiaceae bacterium]
MDKDKKNINYWDKYYGSGKDRKDRYTDYDKRQSPKNVKENQSGKSPSRRNFEPGGKIIGSEYKVRPAAKKRKKSPALRFTILIIIVFLAGFFTFYAIDNQLFSKNKESGAVASNSTISNITENTTSAAEEINISTDNSDSGKNSDESLWQALILFFKNLGKDKSDTEDYPQKLNLNIYFAVIGEEEIFGSEERTISAGSPKIAAANAVNELLKGPYEDFNFAIIPAGTRLLDVEVANKIAKVNFSQEFLSEGLDTGILDDYIIYTIVNTLLEIPEIEAVSFAIDGKDIKEYGNVDLRLPAIRNEKYLEKPEPQE